MCMEGEAGREREVGCGAARKSHRDMIHYKEATKQGPWWLWGRESFPVSIRLHFALVIPAAQNTVEQLELEHRRVTIWRHINHSCAERQRDRGQMAFHLPSFMKSYHRPDWPVSNCTAAKTSWTRSASDRGSRTHKRPRDFVSGALGSSHRQASLAFLHLTRDVWMRCFPTRRVSEMCYGQMFLLTSMQNSQFRLKYSLKNKGLCLTELNIFYF